MSDEIWLPVVGWESFYLISDFGNVWAKARVVHYPNGQIRLYEPHEMKAYTSEHSSYPTVTLRDGWGRSSPRKIHIMVLEAHVGPRPDGLVGCHDDDNPTHNWVGNLSWDTQSNNIRNCLRLGNHPTGATLDRCPNGHEYTPANTYRPPRGGRRCRTCQRDRAVARQHINAPHAQKVTL